VAKARKLRHARGLSPAYAQRIARAQAKGKTLQEARGHRAGEHVTRKQREAAAAAAEGKLTTYQRSQIKKFSIEQAKRSGDPFDDIYSHFLIEAKERGYAQFRELVDTTKRWRRETRPRQRDKIVVISGRARRSEQMGNVAREWGIDASWLRYHP
jgi:hypothetical protein